MKNTILLFVSLLWLAGCKTAPVPASAPLEPLLQWLPKQEQTSWSLMQLNISPSEPKHPGDPPPVKGIVVGALHKADPDYYFHWVRDSSNVMGLVAEAAYLKRPYMSAAELKQKFADFLELTAKLQTEKSKYGLGEPRYTVQGNVDTLPWSRPQYDGPALRVLAVLKFLRAEGVTPDRALELKAKRVITTDLKFVADVYDKRGFDVWEEYKAENYHTRLVQLSALEKGAAYLEAQKPKDAKLIGRLRAAAAALEKVLDDHWDPARGFLRSQLAIEATDGYTAKKTDLDSAVVVAVIEADRSAVAHSVLDDRVQATVHVLEDLFRTTYPINARTDIGLGYGRYFGDVYYGGNPWYLITAYYAEFYYRLARRLQEGAAFEVTKRNLEFVKSATALDVKPGAKLSAGSSEHQQLVRDFIAKGDSILRRFQLHTPADGQLYEQFDKVTGKPASSRGIGWSHSAFLSAVLERLRLRGN